MSTEVIKQDGLNITFYAVVFYFDPFIFPIEGCVTNSIVTFILDRE